MIHHTLNMSMLFVPATLTALSKLERSEPALVGQWLESNPVSIQEMKQVEQQIKLHQEDEYRC